MKIQLRNWKVSNINFSLIKDENERDNNSFDLESGNYFSDKKGDNTFGVRFKLTIKDKSFNLFVEAVFHFEIIDEEITEEFKLSPFPKINAPAIAFPYLRAFISNLTLQSGLEPIILPSINFVELANKDKSQED